MEEQWIENAGGCIITKNLLNRESHFKWIFREIGVNSEDNGWRAFGEEDSEEYVNDPKNLVVVDFNTLAKIEPAVLRIYELPVGSDLVFHPEGPKGYFTDAKSGQRIDK